MRAEKVTCPYFPRAARRASSNSLPAFYFSGGTDFIGRPPGWGVEQVNAYTERNYHQPSDELTADWSFDGMVQDAQFGFYAGLIVANDSPLPAWNSGNEFEAARRAALGK